MIGIAALPGELAGKYEGTIAVGQDEAAGNAERAQGGNACTPRSKSGTEANN